MERSFICDKNLCCGCKACVQICPHNGITLIKLESGFDYPIRNENCIQCGLCKMVCPILNLASKNKKEDCQVYTMQIHNKNILFDSSSGGGLYSYSSIFMR